MTLTTWKDEHGNWVVTRFPTPICFKCTTNNTAPGSESSTPARMETIDAQKLTARCTGCESTYYREVA